MYQNLTNASFQFRLRSRRCVARSANAWYPGWLLAGPLGDQFNIIGIKMQKSRSTPRHWKYPLHNVNHFVKASWVALRLSHVIPFSAVEGPPVEETGWLLTARPYGQLYICGQEEVKAEATDILSIKHWCIKLCRMGNGGFRAVIW